MSVTADDVVRAFRSARGGSTERILERLRADRPAARAALEEVARTRRGALRSYAGTLAAQVLPKEHAVPLLLRIAKSRDPDTRDTAIQDLLEVDANAILPLLRSFRRDLERRDELDVRFKIWMLARLRDQESVPRLHEIAASLPLEHITGQSATLAALVIERDVDALRERRRAGGPEDPALIERACTIAGIGAE